MKCFCCGQKAIAIANTCSPTSASGMTSPKSWCVYCLLSIRGVNILEWLIPIKEVKKALEDTIKYASTLVSTSVNVADNRRVITRGNQMLETMEKCVDIRIRKVKVLKGKAKTEAEKQGLSPDDLVIVTTKINDLPEYSIEKVVGDPVSYLLGRKKETE